MESNVIFWRTWKPVEHNVRVRTHQWRREDPPHISRGMEDTYTKKWTKTKVARHMISSLFVTDHVAEWHSGDVMTSRVEPLHENIVMSVMFEVRRMYNQITGEANQIILLKISIFSFSKIYFSISGTGYLKKSNENFVRKRYIFFPTS